MADAVSVPHSSTTPRPSPVTGAAPGAAPVVGRGPSITRLFTATFFAVALFGLINQAVAWDSARRTQSAMLELTRRLEALQRFDPTPGLTAQVEQVQELAAEASDNAIQAAAGTTVILGAMLIVLGLAFWYNRRRLAKPFARVVTALERIATGNYGESERLPENQPDEFGTIARGVNRMASSLSWREQMQEYGARLLAALNAPAGEAGGVTQALGVLAAATGAVGVALYQPDYDANTWAPSVTGGGGIAAQPITRVAMREVAGEGRSVIQYAVEAAAPVRERLRLSGPAGTGLALGPLHNGERLVGLLAVVPAAAFTEAHRAALEHALPNLAIACERESAHQRTRRLATEIRHTARHLEEQSDELQRVNAELDRVSRLKSEFLANMSHELRTPLNSIIGFSEMLLTEDTGPLTAMQRDFLETVARNGRDLLQLISELLDLSKIEAGRFTLQLAPLDLREVFQEAATIVRAQAERRKHQLQVDVPPDPLTAQADRMRVRQVLLNLLSNAIKFTPDGGRITLTGRPTEGGREVLVEVQDSGIGIAPEDQPKLFKEFTQLDASASRQYEGTGLGLALSHRLVVLHGGQMSLRSAPGQGSTFWFTLPAAR
jgi:signal transduction histidine kinase/HAMP domain-containing protein